MTIGLDLKAAAERRIAEEVPAWARDMTPQDRKARPVARGVLEYFPNALLEVAHVSFVANEQHNPGQPMHWSKGKSTDHADAMLRHQLEHGKVDSDGLLHSAKVAWRALAQLETELENAAADRELREKKFKDNCRWLIAQRIRRAGGFMKEDSDASE